jgi:hypothetical protein
VLNAIRYLARAGVRLAHAAGPLRAVADHLPVVSQVRATVPVRHSPQHRANARSRAGGARGEPPAPGFWTAR